MQVDDAVSKLIGKLGGEDELRLFLSGPCGIGKSAVSTALAMRYPGLLRVGHDDLKQPSMPIACSILRFDPFGCFSPLIEGLDKFVIDIGGGCVFRPNVDNEARFKRLQEFREAYRLRFVLLTARDDAVEARYLSCKNRHQASFEEDYGSWKANEEPWWTRLADVILDTT